MNQLEFKLYDEEIDIDGHVDARGIKYIGKAFKQNNGKFIALADVHGSLCWVEIIVKGEKP